MKKILTLLSIPILFVVFSFPVVALSPKALHYTTRLMAAFSSFQELVVQIILWFVFFTVAAFGAYFIANTLILINNNRQYRYLIGIDDGVKTASELSLQKHTLKNVKSAEKRLVLLGAVIAFFALLCLVLSASLYLEPSLIARVWPVIYYGVAILIFLIIVYTILFVIERIQYSSLPKGDLAAVQLYNRLQIVKNRLKLFVICIMLLIALYFALLITVARSVTDATHL